MSRALPRAAWLAQPAYLAAEVGLAVAAGVGYSLRDDTISALGTSCHPGAAACSSAPLMMNVVFVLFGVLQAIGALPLLAGRRREAMVGLLWVVAGVASIGVGLLPVDRHPTGHALVALPVFAVQPVAVLLHARLLPPGAARRVGLLLATVALVGVACFVALLGHDQWVGLAERAAIWPAKLWLPVGAVATAGWLRPGPRPGPRPDGTAPASPPTARGR